MNNALYFNVNNNVFENGDTNREILHYDNVIKDKLGTNLDDSEHSVPNNLDEHDNNNEYDNINHDKQELGTNDMEYSIPELENSNYDQP
eukprot:Pgem_evm1s16801